jgi:hypothetical protein
MLSNLSNKAQFASAVEKRTLRAAKWFEDHKAQHRAQEERDREARERQQQLRHLKSAHSTIRSRLIEQKKAAR